MKCYFFQWYKYAIIFAKPLPDHFGEIDSINASQENVWGSNPGNVTVHSMPQRWHMLSRLPKDFRTLAILWKEWEAHFQTLVSVSHG